MFTSYALRPSSRATTAFNYYSTTTTTTTLLPRPAMQGRSRCLHTFRSSWKGRARHVDVPWSLWDRCSSGCIAVGAGLGRADVAFHASGHYRIVAPWASGDGTALLVNLFVRIGAWALHAFVRALLRWPRAVAEEGDPSRSRESRRSRSRPSRASSARPICEPCGARTPFPYRASDVARAWSAARGRFRSRTPHLKAERGAFAAYGFDGLVASVIAYSRAARAPGEADRCSRQKSLSVFSPDWCLAFPGPCPRCGVVTRGGRLRRRPQHVASGRKSHCRECDRRRGPATTPPIATSYAPRGGSRSSPPGRAESVGKVGASASRGGEEATRGPGPSPEEAPARARRARSERGGGHRESPSGTKAPCARGAGGAAIRNPPPFRNPPAPLRLDPPSAESSQD